MTLQELGSNAGHWIEIELKLAFPVSQDSMTKRVMFS